MRSGLRPPRTCLRNQNPEENQSTEKSGLDWLHNARALSGFVPGVIFSIKMPRMVRGFELQQLWSRRSAMNALPNPDFLRRAIELATRNVMTGAGGPFGAVIVLDGTSWPRV